ncbi:MAG TPA: serine protease [Candidatus Angelobacter sp.]|jgi:S1-C subfamily serine protease|nr:serine protease [Candidatus Angelobacter sp.]
MNGVCWCGRTWQPGEETCPQCGRRPVPWSTPGYSPPPPGWHGGGWGGPRAVPLPQPVAAPTQLRPRRWLVPALLLLLVVVLVVPMVAGYRSVSVGGDQISRALPRSLTSPAPTITARPLADVASASLGRVVTIETQTPDHQELGTGWLLDGRGDFVTNAHVVEGAISVRIRDRRNATHVGAIMGVDHDQDIAVVRSLDGFDGKALVLSAGSDPPVPSDVVVLASGRATGHDDQTATVETIARLHQDVPVRGNTEIDPSSASTVLYHDMIAMRGKQVFPGNSGGPVLDAYGVVIGIVTLASRSTPQAYAIPVGRVSAELFGFAGRPTP